MEFFLCLSFARSLIMFSCCFCLCISMMTKGLHIQKESRSLWRTIHNLFPSQFTHGKRRDTRKRYVCKLYMSLFGLWFDLAFPIFALWILSNEKSQNDHQNIWQQSEHCSNHVVENVSEDPRILNLKKIRIRTPRYVRLHYPYPSPSNTGSHFISNTLVLLSFSYPSSWHLVGSWVLFLPSNSWDLHFCRLRLMRILLKPIRMSKMAKLRCCVQINVLS